MKIFTPVTIEKQMRYHNQRLRKNRYERSIAHSIEAWQHHFAEGQTNNHFIVSMPPDVYIKFREFIDKQTASGQVSGT